MTPLSDRQTSTDWRTGGREARNRTSRHQHLSCASSNKSLSLSHYQTFHLWNEDIWASNESVRFKTTQNSSSLKWVESILTEIQRYPANVLNESIMPDTIFEGPKCVGLCATHFSCRVSLSSLNNPVNQLLPFLHLIRRKLKPWPKMTEGQGLHLGDFHSKALPIPCCTIPVCLKIQCVSESPARGLSRTDCRDLIPGFHSHWSPDDADTGVLGITVWELLHYTRKT